MNRSYRAYLDRSKAQKKTIRKLLKRLKRTNPPDLDKTFHELHDEAFEEIDCLQCANCCKTTGPRFTNKDIERIASHQGLKPGQFVERYLRIDEDGDYVLQSVPCPFLGPDNYCGIYEVRPQACRQYPHTDHRKIQQVLDITDANSRICPAVANIVLKLAAVRY